MSEQFEQELNMKNCLKKCLKTSHSHVKTVLGSKEVAKSLYREQPVQLVILSNDLIQKYREIIEAKCKTSNIPIVTLETREEFAEIFPVKLKRAGAAAILDFVSESREKAFLMNEIKH